MTNADALPESAYPRCVECGAPVSTSAGALHEIAGYERDREQGGTNHVIARRRTGRIVGRCCALRVQSGIPIEQGRLV